MTVSLQDSRADPLKPILASAVTFLIGVLYHWPLKLDHDVSYFLATAHFVNKGARLYVDLLELNTPAPVELSQLSDWFATYLGTPLDLTHKALLLIVMAGCLAASLAVTLPLLRRSGIGPWVIAIGLAAVIMFSAAQAIGAREHLCCILMMPWALSIAMGQAKDDVGLTRSRAFHVLIGAAAGFGMFFKPHFIVFGLGLGLIDLIRARGRLNRLALSTWIAAAVGGGLYIYLALQPGYIAEMLPFYLQTMGALRGDEMWALRDPWILLAIVALGFLMIRPGKGETWAWLPISVSAVFCVLALAIFVQQGFGFDYQLMPLKIGVALSAVFALAWRSSTPAESKQTISPAGLSAIALVALSGLWIAFAVIDSHPKPYPTRKAMMNHPLFAAMQPPHPGDPVLAISTSVDPFAEYLTVMEVKWSSPNLASLPIASLISQDGRYAIETPLAPEVRERLASWYRKKAAETLRAKPPMRVAVETSEKPMFFDNGGFDLLAWMREDPDFNAAWTAARLQKIGEPIPYENRTYQMYRPTGPLSASK